MGEGTQRLPGASLVVGRPSLTAMVLFLAGAFLGILLASRILEQRRSRPQAFLILCLFWAGSVFFFFSPPRKGLSAVFLDVGQGDGIFLSCGGRTMLMDCGSSQEKELGKDCLVPFLKSRGVDRLDTVFISHGDWDHISGIRYALEEPGCRDPHRHAGDAGAGKGKGCLCRAGLPGRQPRDPGGLRKTGR